MASMKQAIADKCRDCIYDSAVPGTWREQVEMCRSEKTCALWPYRPITVATMNKTRKENNEQAAKISSILDGLDDEEDGE